MNQTDGGGRWSVFDKITFARSNSADCTCIMDCQDHPPTACSLSGEWHVHPGEPCPVHPDAPGDH
jgi:hypothetical protein